MRVCVQVRRCARAHVAVMILVRTMRISPVAVTTVVRAVLSGCHGELLPRLLPWRQHQTKTGKGKRAPESKSETKHVLLFRPPPHDASLRALLTASLPVWMPTCKLAAVACPHSSRFPLLAGRCRRRANARRRPLNFCRRASSLCRPRAVAARG